PTQTPEWRQGGNNWAGYMQVMANKQAQKEQAAYQAMLKKQQEIDRWLTDQEGKRSRGEPLDPKYQELLKAQEAYQAQLASEMRAVQEAAARQKARKDARNAAL